MSKHQQNLPQGDLLYGHRAVAAFLGVPKGTAKHLMRAGLIPAFPLGDVYCSRRSSLTRHLDTLEADHGERR